jgi:hypothetical protein
MKSPRDYDPGTGKTKERIGIAQSESANGLAITSMLISVSMAPGPVLFLFVVVQAFEVMMRIAVGLSDPLVVIDNLVVVPPVVVVIVGIVDSDVMVIGAAGIGQR